MSDIFECPHPNCGKKYDRRKSLTDGHFRLNPDHKPVEWPECSVCGERYNRISNHWGNSCEYPEITDYQWEILTGLMMSDASLERTGRNPRVQITNFTEPEYLEYIDDIFGVLGCGVKDSKTSEEVAEYMGGSGSDSGASKDQYSDQYTWRTRSHPELSRFESWYSTGKKVWPEDIELTPTVLKSWFIGDGNLNDSSGSLRISISLTKEYDNKDKIRSYFNSVGLPEPNYFSDSKAHWNKQESLKVYGYMGDPVPGFEYKWDGV